VLEENTGEVSGGAAENKDTIIITSVPQTSPPLGSRDLHCRLWMGNTTPVLGSSRKMQTQGEKRRITKKEVRTGFDRQDGEDGGVAVLQVVRPLYLPIPFLLLVNGMRLAGLRMGNPMSSLAGPRTARTGDTTGASIFGGM